MTYAETDDSKKKVEQDSSRRGRKDKRRRNEISDDEITSIETSIMRNTSSFCLYLYYFVNFLNRYSYRIQKFSFRSSCNSLYIFLFTVKKPRKQITDHQPVSEAKLLDDLFRRTKAAPSIYWLPLSEEQVSVTVFVLNGKIFSLGTYNIS